MMDKTISRSHFRQIRDLIPPKRHRAARDVAKKWLLQRVNQERLVLSYVSFGSELVMQELNRLILERGQLVLPRVEGDHLELFHVESEGALIQNQWGIGEPNPILCQKANHDELTLALIPGLAFDIKGNRIGYGRGYYDRLLPSLPKSTHLIGIGFTEQHSPTLLATTPYDIPVQKLALF